ncbi:hypothetical protein ACFVVM_32810 [Nocardia sp. NPDC058176]|uniref:hypothetical protein n=1 Tax=Nocardia sp. NPDC058176 TaxID=3346368 RepID=UPI0036D918E5
MVSGRPLVVVDEHQIRRAQGLLAHIPFVGPGQDVVADAAVLVLALVVLAVVLIIGRDQA